MKMGRTYNQLLKLPITYPESPRFGDGNSRFWIELIPKKWS